MRVQIANGLVVSDQALPDDSLNSSFMMPRLAVAAEQGGAVGIRINRKSLESSKRFIQAIESEVL